MLTGATNGNNIKLARNLCGRRFPNIFVFSNWSRCLRKNKVADNASPSSCNVPMTRRSQPILHYYFPQPDSGQRPLMLHIS